MNTPKMFIRSIKKSNRSTLFIIIVICLSVLSSCGNSDGAYYTSGYSDNEFIQINEDTSVQLIGCAAFEVYADSSFNVLVMYKLIDTSKDFKLSNIVFEINGLKSSAAEKHALFIDAPLKIKYHNSLTEIGDLNQRLKTGMPIEFTFKFGRMKLGGKKRVHGSLIVTMFDGDMKKEISKSFNLVRRARYRSPFLWH